MPRKTWARYGARNKDLSAYINPEEEVTNDEIVQVLRWQMNLAVRMEHEDPDNPQIFIKMTGCGWPSAALPDPDELLRRKGKTL